MCGRVSIAVDYETLDKYLFETFKIKNFKGAFAVPRYNIAPGQPLLTMLHDGKQLQAGTILWGLIPEFSTVNLNARKIVNAKAETLFLKPSFKSAAIHKRCVVFVDGFYEWQTITGDKVPTRFERIDQKIFPLAGIYSTVTTKENNKIHTCAIITTKANELMEPIHHRMPVIFNNETAKIWVDRNTKNSDTLSSLLKPYKDSDMRAYRVSKTVNNARNDDPECLIEIV